MTGRFASTITEMVIVAADGKQRQMTCLPLRKLTGWLMSIHPNKVKPELREGIIAYQNECDDALWAYWNDQRLSVATPQSTPEIQPLFAQQWLTTFDSSGSQHTRLLPMDVCIFEHCRIHRSRFAFE
ncbi:phage antirepressor N-terminal domain-containing protein [Pseudomonas sp. NPDC086251]|uniref:phage antirepressor N-terminal domain-containing protein n=1 Tax=Pseudomonas sp. NPDC086251 TaxID=3364431 RepID=UPI003832632F